ncbi:hypothetical protein ACX3O0_15265 [Homoserinimonas sp. A447]
MTLMDYLPVFGMLGLLIPLLITAVTLLVFYGLVRVAVSHGLRDHHKWTRRQPPAAAHDDWPIGE